MLSEQVPKSVKRLIRRTPILGPYLLQLRNRRFRSARYWERRYRKGGNSGSFGDSAAFKAEIVNTFVAGHDIQSVIEFGSGDGNLLQHMRYPGYTGVDVSHSAVQRCRNLYRQDKTKRFLLAQPGADYGRHDLALSLDVIYHLVEDSVFEAYMRDLCRAATRFVMIYSSNGDPLNGTFDWYPHVRHRRFTDWMDANQSGWILIEKIPNRSPFRRENDVEYGSFSDFYIYGKTS
jgi:hypothetical protein